MAAKKAKKSSSLVTKLGLKKKEIKSLNKISRIAMFGFIKKKRVKKFIKDVEIVDAGKSGKKKTSNAFSGNSSGSETDGSDDFGSNILDMAEATAEEELGPDKSLVSKAEERFEDMSEDAFVRSQHLSAISCQIARMSRLYEDLYKAHGGKRHRAGFLEEQIKPLEVQVKETLRLLRNSLFRIEFDFEEIDPGKIPDDEYFGSYLSRRDAYRFRHYYWNNLLFARDKPWAIDNVQEESKSCTGSMSPFLDCKPPGVGRARCPKTLFVWNLPFSVQQSDIENFFQDCGEVVDVRLSLDEYGMVKGFGHVEFATAEAAQYALEMNGKKLLNCAVQLDFDRQREAFTPNINCNYSAQNGGRGLCQTIYVRGFDKNLGEDEIRAKLEEHFGTCGEVTRVSIPKDFESGYSKGFAFVDFNDSSSLNKSFELDGSELDGYSLTVEEAKSTRGAGGRDCRPPGVGLVRCPKTLFVWNLSFSVQQSDIENFFQDCGEVVDVRLALNEYGMFKGFGHVEFATAEAAQYALEMNGQKLLNCAVQLDFDRQREAFTPNNNCNYSAPSGGRGLSQTIYVRGFDKNLGEDEIRAKLEEHFGTCGEVTSVSIPKDFESGYSKGFAFVDFNDSSSLNKAFELNGSELDGYSLTVDEAKLTRGGRGWGSPGGKSGGGRGGGCGGGLIKDKFFI